jgi:hypothetical protein
MKKLLLPALLMVFVLQAIAQKDSTKESKFQFGVGVGLGVLTQAPQVINLSGEVNSEFKPTKGFSVYGALGYNRLFDVGGEGEGSIGFASLVAGPRAYLSPKFFVGVGGGLAYFSMEGESATVFEYDPHIGYSAKHTQLILGYNGLTNNGANLGFVQLKTIFKFK